MDGRGAVERELRGYLDVSLGFIGDFHDELGLSIYHVLQNALVDAARTMRYDRTGTRTVFTYTAPKLSELDTKRYSLPSASN